MKNKPESTRVRMSAKGPLPDPHLISVMVTQMSGKTEEQGSEGRLEESNLYYRHLPLLKTEGQEGG